MNGKLAKLFFDLASKLAMAKVEWKPRAYRKAALSIEKLDRSVESIYKEGGLKALEEINGVGKGIASKIEEFVKTGKIEQGSLPVLKVPKDRGPARKYKVVLKVAEKVVKVLNNSGAASRIEIAGSLRRKKETVHDIDLLATSRNPAKLMEAFTSMKGVKVLAKGLSKTMLILKNGIEVDLRIVPAKSWGAALLYFTGSKQFNISLRKKAIKLGFKLSEYGLFNRKSGAFVAGKTEKEVFSKLGVDYVAPTER